MMMKDRTSIIARTSMFTAILVATIKLIPGIPIIGLRAAKIQVGVILCPLIGMLLPSAYEALLVGVLASIILDMLNGFRIDVVMFNPALISNVLISNLVFRGRRKVMLAILASMLFLWYFLRPIGFQLWFIPIPFATASILSIILTWTLRGGKYMRCVLANISGILGDHLAGCIMFNYLSKPVFGIKPSDLIHIYYVALPLTVIERTLMIAGGVLLSLGVLKALPRRILRYLKIKEGK